MRIHAHLARPLALLTLTTTSASAATISQFALSDHPDGNQNPPPYGLRMDNLFGAAPGVTTFSFDHFADTVLTATDNGSSIHININGTIWGGVTHGVNTGYAMGAYTLDFNFVANVNASGTGWIVSPGSLGANNGTLTVLAGNANLATGSVINFFENTSPAQTFLFLQDEHRLAGHPQAGLGFWVGRGWNTTNANGSPTGHTMDVLFLGEAIASQIIPLPTAGLLGGAGLFALAARRRR